MAKKIIAMMLVLGLGSRCFSAVVPTPGPYGSSPAPYVASPTPAYGVPSTYGPTAAPYGVTPGYGSTAAPYGSSPAPYSSVSSGAYASGGAVAVGGVSSFDKTIAGGTRVAEIAAAKLAAPFVLLNSKIAAGAGALPPLLAAKGALLGSAIATPITVGASIASGIASGVSGAVVSVPIAIVTGVKAKASELASSFQSQVHTGEVVLQQGAANLQSGIDAAKGAAVSVGHILLRPIAVVAGAKTAIGGAALGLVGEGVKAVGTKVSAIGAGISGAGAATKGIGGKWLGWGLDKGTGASVSLESLIPQLPVISLDSLKNLHTINLPSMPSFPVNSLLQAVKQPSSLSAEYTLNSPLLGYHHQSASLSQGGPVSQPAPVAPAPGLATSY